jgi:hypothetical protein
MLYLRQKDLEWFHSSREVREELMQVLSTRVVPREFSTEIEQYRQGQQPPGDRPFIAKTGEVNEKKRQQTQLNSRRKATSEKRKRGNKSSHPSPKEKQRRDVRHVFGDNIQLTYKVQDLTNKSNSAGSGATISVASSPEGILTFRQYPKLSKRLILWCFPLDPANTESDPENGGFPRTDLIPLSNLFRGNEEED